MTTSKHSMLIIALVAIVVLSGVIVYGHSRSNSQTPTARSGCGLTITSPRAHARVTFPLEVNGTIDNSNSTDPHCQWTMFEGFGGSAQLSYNYQNQGWKDVGTSSPIKVTDWTSPVTDFTTTIDFNNGEVGLPHGIPMKITLIPDNPSGMPNSKSVELLITYN